EDRVDGPAMEATPLWRHLGAPRDRKVAEGWRRRHTGTVSDGFARYLARPAQRLSSEARSLAAVRKSRRVVEGTLPDLLVDPVHQSLDTATVVGGIRQGRLFAATDATIGEIEVQGASLGAGANLSHGPFRHWP